MTTKKDLQEYVAVIRYHIEASSPCTLKHVFNWATEQGYGGSKMVQALQVLKTDGVVCVYEEDDDVIVELL